MSIIEGFATCVSAGKPDRCGINRANKLPNPLAGSVCVIEAVLRALLVDPHIPRETCERLIQRILEDQADPVWEIPPSVGIHCDMMWQIHPTIFRQPGLELLGASPGGLPPKTRVTQILTMETLLRRSRGSNARRLRAAVENQIYFASRGTLIDTAIQQLNYEKSELDLVYRNEGARRSVCWVCLESEVLAKQPRDIQRELGLFYFRPGTHLAAFSYDIESSHLHIPTMLDARFYRHFVPKPIDLPGTPRAWDWTSHAWGMTEMIHHPHAPFFNASARYLGQITADETLGLDLPLGDISIASSRIEAIVSQALRMSVAHDHLEPFLSGNLDILTIGHREFEQFLQILFQREGYRVDLTQQSRDGGIDLVAFSDLTTSDGLLIQAKHSAGTVGIGVVRELIGARFLAGSDLSGHVLTVATTGRFSKVAQDAQMLHPNEIKLIDYQNLMARLSGYRNAGKADIAGRALDMSHALHVN
jgi:hypothetical protein